MKELALTITIILVVIILNLILSSCTTTGGDEFYNIPIPDWSIEASTLDNPLP